MADGFLYRLKVDICLQLNRCDDSKSHTEVLSYMDLSISYNILLTFANNRQSFTDRYEKYFEEVAF